MDANAFDRLTRALGASGTRRRLLGVAASLGLGGVLSALDGDSAEAKRRRQGKRKRRNSKNKNRKNNGNGNGGGNNSGGLGGTQCVATGGDCNQDSDCCGSNCFDFTCADKSHTCSGTRCLPPAKGCQGNTCCYGDIACDVCCDPGITQCNGAGNCCAPNCAGRQCGPDGCGAGGTCGTCPTNSTCNQDGVCVPTCTPQCQGKQCGPDGCGGSCGGCGTGTTCNASGQCVPNCIPQCAGKECGPDHCGGTCGTCTGGTVCDQQTGQCVVVPNCDVCPDCRYTTVQAAVQDENGPSTITICPGTYTESIFVGRNLTLVGSGQGNGPGDTILQWSGQNGVVVINGNVDAFTLKDLRITGAPDGGGVDTQAATTTVTNCTITGISGRGSGIQSSGTLIMTGCTISDNVQTDSSDVFGGGISSLGDATLTNCTVTGNKAISTGNPNQALGGGIFMAQGTLTLSGTSVTGNSTNGNGGGVYLDEGANSIVLHNNSTLSGNTPNDCASAQLDLCP